MGKQPTQPHNNTVRQGGSILLVDVNAPEEVKYQILPTSTYSRNFLSPIAYYEETILTSGGLL